jgi:hypothetical protein
MINPWDVNVGHPSVLGNPFVKKGVVVETERDKVCNLYDTWFHENIDKIEHELDKLKSKYKEHGKLNLFCWCYPKRCHAETIKNYLERESK